MNPKFHVNEEVILLGDYYGEYTVHEVIYLEDGKTDKYPTRKFDNGSPNGYTGYAYDLGFLVPGDVFATLAPEESLRKKHQKGDYSFSELMSTLKIGEKA